MTAGTDFEIDAQEYYDASFGNRVEPLTEEDVLSVEHLTHSFREYDLWEVLLATGGPAARVVVEVDEWGEPARATFEYQDWFQPWNAPANQDRALLLAWVSEHFYFGCGYCDQERLT